MWLAVKIAAAFSAALLVIFFLGLVVMVTRPALLTGVGGDDLAHSLRGDSGAPSCKKLGGDWECQLEADRAMTVYRVKVNWMGCWKATRVSGPVTAYTPASRDGCIQLGDIIRFDEQDD